jgi:hypothetical protein
MSPVLLFTYASAVLMGTCAEKAGAELSVNLYFLLPVATSGLSASKRALDTLQGPFDTCTLRFFFAARCTRL